MKVIEVGPEVRKLHKKYSEPDDNNRIPRYKRFEGVLTSDELFRFDEAFMFAPRIGRMANNRKKDDELIAVPRALLLFLTNQTRDTVHIYQEWLKGNLVDIRSHSLQPTEQEGGQDGADTP